MRCVTLLTSGQLLWPADSSIIFLLESGAHLVRAMNFVTSSVSRVAGVSGVPGEPRLSSPISHGPAGYTNGAALFSTFNTPEGMCFSKDGLTLFVMDSAVSPDCASMRYTLDCSPESPDSKSIPVDGFDNCFGHDLGRICARKFRWLVPV